MKEKSFLSSSRFVVLKVKTVFVRYFEEITFKSEDNLVDFLIVKKSDKLTKKATNGVKLTQN